ncbi:MULTISPECIES: pyruvate, phosphate dikinase [Trueperella]|uniref:Pyruvate, phosphate dikinase n=1 Tax=Trueperella bernardiae TaxID=59561 RepID=A0AAW6ZJ75_9ACTO|nr:MULTISPECIES: pyruvate, phosphate dikinase [Trueperella]MCM3907951.1 pyruvate, phosphate dikinase [Trueperella bernardiae]MDK8601694.1 pyruvate, phosphate dikinase [Trueperella bernardiae]OCW60672.1 pyruvate phosphate dikinase [Trueperella bernardiae]OFS67740.1 pyruvate, phosphate dikinase [Trueperella sp. HMSC08H06]PKZ89381.1 pyruvate, phosphate dikinase [Trueperella bernardiae]
MTKYVYDFTEGDKDQKDLLGGKGANLAEMTNLGLPVPPGFTITTEACRVYLNEGAAPEELDVQVTGAIREVEAKMGKHLGDPADPLLMSVRSGAKFSMPGMMETVLNIGLNDESVLGLAEQSGDERFAWDSYRRLVQMFGKTVLHIEGEPFADALHALQDEKGYAGDPDMTTEDLQRLVVEFKAIVKEATGHDFPQNPREQLDLAIKAVFNSWNTERARIYRRREHIPNDIGTAVNVQTMVFGNMGAGSGTGVCFTRDPSTGHSGVYGDYLENAQGEDVVAGIRNTLPLSALGELDKKSYDELLAIMDRLEIHYRDLCDIEFTVERGKLWMLQTRVGKRTPAAAFRVADQLVDERLITRDEAVTRVTGDQLTSLLFPQFDKDAKKVTITRGMPASPGAAVGEIVMDNATAVARTQAGAKVVLVRRETNPEDLQGMVVSEGILTARGGKTSHAAVVARGMGRCCVVGADDLVVDDVAGTMKVKSTGKEFKVGDIIAIDGTTGEIFEGDVPVTDSPVTTYLAEGLEAGLAAAHTDDDRDLVGAVDRIMSHADEKRRMLVRANADSPEDAARARAFGAQGIGLCRTEHMFLGSRRKLIEKMILAHDEATQAEALAELLPYQREDFIGIFDAMDGLPVTVRLIDPPLHEFLPDLTDLSVKLAVKEAKGEEITDDERELLAAVKSHHEQNPMLGLRGVRLGLKIPGLIRLQVRAIAEAAAHLMKEGKDPKPEIMVPLIGGVRELQIVRDMALEVIAEVSKETGVELDLPIGNMIELPRAAVSADTIATESDFFSFGTNDLTQTTWGFSRDDVEGTFFNEYFDYGVFGVSPFESVDLGGVGALVDMGVQRGRHSKPNMKMGVCGEHGGDPSSIHFFEKVGLNYVSCSPFRVPVARLESGRAAIENETTYVRHFNDL